MLIWLLISKLPFSSFCHIVARWSSWSEWSICSPECIQVRRRKCLTHAVAAAASIADVADEVGELLPGGVGAAALSSGSSDGATNSNSNINSNSNSNNNGDADGPGYGKSLCAGKDIQTAECRGEQCQIGKDGKCVYDNNRKSVRQSGSQQQSRQLDNNNNHSGHNRHNPDPARPDQTRPHKSRALSSDCHNGKLTKCILFVHIRPNIFAHPYLLTK